MLLFLIFQFLLKKVVNFAVFLILFLFVTSSIAVEQSNQDHQRIRRFNGYDCGKSYFTDQMVSDALNIALSDEGHESVRSYIGPLFDVKRGYLTWPIVQDEKTKGLKEIITKWKIWRESKYQVVFDKNGNVIDVIVRLSNNDFAKCWRVDSTQSETQIQSQEVLRAKGYYCGSRFIPSEHLEMAADFARKYIGKNIKYLSPNKRYPAPYIGHLYDEDLGFMIWPIYEGNLIYTSSESSGGPFFIMIDPTGQIKDVVVRTYDNNFVKCIISNSDQAVYAWHDKARVDVMSLRSGFDCNGVFFRDYDLQFASLAAQKSRSTSRSGIFPLEYNGPSFDSSCLLWPVVPSDRNSITGASTSYRLVLTPKFEIICVAIQGHNMIKKCKRKTIACETLKHDQNDYQCGRKVFSKNKLVSTAYNACKGGIKYKMFPRKYEGVTFDIPGPYLIYPIKKKGNFQNRKIKGSLSNYLVMNYDCVFVGALTTDTTTNDLKKCDIRPKEKRKRKSNPLKEMWSGFY